MKGDNLDPKALIREAFRIDGISAPECRSIFLDWALSLPDSAAVNAALPQLLALYDDAPKDHPMLIVLQDAVRQSDASTPQGRRGGRQARVQQKRLN